MIIMMKCRKEKWLKYNCMSMHFHLKLLTLYWLGFQCRVNGCRKAMEHVDGIYLKYMLTCAPGFPMTGGLDGLSKLPGGILK